MKKWMETHIGKSWRTTIVSYVLAMGAVLQPIIESVVYSEDFHFTFAFVFRLFFAGGMAFMGKYAADSAQVKHVDTKVEQLKNE